MMNWNGVSADPRNRRSTSARVRFDRPNVPPRRRDGRRLDLDFGGNDSVIVAGVLTNEMYKDGTLNWHSLPRPFRSVQLTVRPKSFASSRRQTVNRSIPFRVSPRHTVSDASPAKAVFTAVFGIRLYRLGAEPAKSAPRLSNTTPTGRLKLVDNSVYVDRFGERCANLDFERCILY